jgi:YVTN family beta-propeller protein
MVSRLPSVTEISTATGDTIQTLSVGLNPDGIAISPNGEQIWVTNYSKDNAGSISVINTVTQKVLPASIDIGGYPYLAIFMPDGKKVYAGPNSITGNASPEMDMISTTTDKPVAARSC